MKILVTGATGFLGRHLVRRLHKVPNTIARIVGTGLSSTRSWQDVKLDADPQTPINFYDECYLNLECEGAVASFLLRYKPDVIFHLAANPHVRENASNPTGITKTNVLATHNLLAYCPEGCRFVFASSTAVYGNSYHCGEGDTEETPTRPNSVYAATKVACEALITAHCHTRGINGLILRYSNMVGAGKDYGLLHDIMANLRSSFPELKLLGKRPGTRRAFLHVSDAVEATVLLGLGNSGPRTFNLATIDTMTVRDVADVVMEQMGIEKPIRWLDEAWKGDSSGWNIDASEARDAGWTLKYPESNQAITQAVKDILEAKS